jgi:hypothetical protein
MRNVRIFIAYTADLTAERKAVSRVVQSPAVRKVAADREIALEVLDWHDAVPDAGLAENIILEQLNPKTWDVFVGVLWHRFGTPTGIRDPSTGIEYSSGTEQEFKTAYSLWEKHHRPRVSFYFSERKPRHIHDIDPQQFQLVKNFIAQFAPKGKTPGLYQTFKTVRSFEELIRTKLIDCLLQTSVKKRSVKRRTKKANSRRSPRTKLDKHGADVLGALVLRGIKETYYRTLDIDFHRCPPVRFNIMVPNHQNDILTIRFVDDDSYYTPAELTKAWLPGEGKCGAAWKENSQQIYASDSNTPERFLEPMEDSTRTKFMELRSVVSTPIHYGGRIVGILNFDSKHDSNITKIQEKKIHSLFSDLAQQIGLLLSSRHVSPSTQ